MGWCSIGLSSRGDLAGASSALASETVGGSKFYMLLCVIFIIIIFFIFFTLLSQWEFFPWGKFGSLFPEESQLPQSRYPAFINY